MRIHIMRSLLAVSIGINLLGNEVTPPHDGGHIYKERECIGRTGIEKNRLAACIRPVAFASIWLSVCGALTYSTYWNLDQLNPEDPDRAKLAFSLLLGGGYGGPLVFLVLEQLGKHLYEDMSCVEEIEVEKGVDDLYPQWVHVRVYDDNGSIYLEKDASRLTKGEIRQLSQEARDCIRDAMGGRKRSAVYYTCRWRPLLISQKFDAYLFDEQGV